MRGKIFFWQGAGGQGIWSFDVYKCEGASKLRNVKITRAV